MEVKAAGITKEFGTAAALAGIDVTVRSGELMALLGPSGSGKTTLLRVIAGLESADSGQIFFGHEDATAIPVRRRGVGFVFQHYALFKHLTVFDNIAYGLRARGRHKPPAAEIRARVMRLLDLGQLPGLEGRFASQLSGGQRQRVALARALAVEPRVLLLDEPFGALDARVRKDLRRWLREVHDETGQTTIFVTHDQDEALELADRVAILNRGRLEQVGTPDEVHDAPSSAFVMSFVGESTRLPVEVASDAVRYRGRILPVQALAIGGDAGLYLRPWDSALVGESPDAIAGQVTLLRRAAGGRRAEIRLADTQDIVEVEIPDGVTLARGERVHVAIRGGHVFRA
jgi:sulfate transport system ATP-binding protein